MGGETMGQDTKVTFMCSEQLADLVSRVSFEIDQSKSEVIRTCILLGIDTLRANPALINKIDLGDRKEHQIRTR
jgi:hypothetical protein